MKAPLALGLGWAALLLSMSFSYNFGANPAIDYPRMLIGDTVNNPPEQPCIFQDQEITAFAVMAAGVWQSLMFWSGTQGTATLPSTPVNYLRTAAYALNAIASNKSALASITKMLDVQLNVAQAAEQLRAQAQEYFDIDDNSMAMVIIEQVHSDWGFRDRFWAQWQRTASM